MGNNTKMLTALISLLLSMVLAQFDPPVVSGTPGKPCTSSFHCWRTEPIDLFGEPVELQRNRRKRLEVGSSFSKGGRCRCIEGTCAQFQQRSQSFLPCEEF
uniref:IlGF domain-containing protein n=1 Tax=Caenorhabditis tropicalis TaxID=1561998 RepID=A0A1I7T4D9_9PELO